MKKITLKKRKIFKLNYNFNYKKKINIFTLKKNV